MLASRPWIIAGSMKLTEEKDIYEDIVLNIYK